MMDPNNNSNNDNNNVLLLLAAITQHQQINLLEILFSINHDPSVEALELIAQRINSTSQNVASWFENRRQQFQAQQAAAAAAAISAGGNHLNLVLNNLMLDPQQLQHHLQQQQNNNHLNHNHHHNHHSNNHQLHSALLDCIAAAPSNLTNNISNSSQYYYDYPLSNASSSPTTNQQPIQLSALNATRNSVDSPPDHIQNNPSNHNHNHHHHHHHNPHQIQDNIQASSTLLAKLTAVTSGLADSPAVAGVAPPPSHNHVLAGNGNVKLDSKMIDLLEALYAINDNPEMAAIEMISKRVDVPCHLISDWFDKKRMKLNPFAGHRSPPINKKREGGRVVTFSEYQRSLLEAIFNENNYLHPQEYEELSKLIQVPSRNIKIWFKNRRSKQRLSSGARTNSVRCDNDSIEQEQEQQLNLHQHHH